MRERPLKNLDWFNDSVGENFDIGVYDHSKRLGLTVSQLLEREKSAKQGEQTAYFGLTRSEVIEKKAALKKAGKNVPLEAIEECFLKAGVRTSGAGADVVSKVWEFSDIDVLFPEFVSNRIYAGMLADSLIPQLIAIETVLTDGLDYRKIYINDSEEERQTGVVNPGSELAETMITVGDQSVKLTKYGRYINSPFEDTKYQRLNVYAMAMERIGKQIQIDMTDDLIYALINGDGNSSTTPGTTVESDTSATIGVADLIEFFTCLPTPYSMTNMVGKKALLVKVYNALVGMYNPMTSYGIPGLNIPKIHEWDRSVVTSDYLIGIDNRYSIEYVNSGAIETDTEKFVKKQTNGTGIWTYSAFGIIDEQANGIFDETHT